MLKHVQWHLLAGRTIGPATLVLQYSSLNLHSSRRKQAEAHLDFVVPSIRPRNNPPTQKFTLALEDVPRVLVNWRLTAPMSLVLPCWTLKGWARRNWPPNGAELVLAYH